MVPENMIAAPTPNARRLDLWDGYVAELTAPRDTLTAVLTGLGDDWA